MKDDLTRISKAIKLTFDGPAWHGPSVMEVLNSIKKENVDRRIGNSHTITEIILHMASWKKFVTEHLSGNDTYEVTDQLNFPSTIEIHLAIENLKNSQEKLLKSMEIFDSERLMEKVPSRKYSFYTMLHGIIQHDLYHIGQVVILNK